MPLDTACSAERPSCRPGRAVRRWVRSIGAEIASTSAVWLAKRAQTTMTVELRSSRYFAQASMQVKSSIASAMARMPRVSGVSRARMSDMAKAAP